MANRYSVELGIDTKGYKEGIDEAKRENAEFSSTVGKANKDLASLNKEFRKAKTEVSNLALEYANLSKAERQTAEGKALRRQLDQAKKAAAQLLDLKTDLNNELKNLASDTAMWDMGKEGIAVTRDVLSALATTIEDVTGKESGLADMIKTVAKIQTIANAAITVGNALQKQSALMTGIRTLQEKALSKAVSLEAASHTQNAATQTIETGAAIKATTAKVAETAATTKATIAQRLFNAVAKANPYVLLAMAVVTVVGALYAYTAATKESKEAEEEREKQTERLKEAQETYAQTTANTASSMIAKYAALKEEWNSLKDSHEKTQFVKNKAKEFKELESGVKNTADAEKYLNEQTDDVIKAMIARAKAAAAAAAAQTLYQKAIELSIQKEQLLLDQSKELAEGPQTVTKTVAGSGGQFGNVQTYTYTETQAEMQERVNKKFQKQIDIMDKQEKELLTKADNYIKKSVDYQKEFENIGIFKTDNNDKQNKIDVKVDEKELEAAKGSIEDIEKQIKDLQDRARKGLLPKEFNTAEKFRAEIKRLNDEKFKIAVNVGLEEPQTYKARLQKELDDVRKQIEFSVPGSIERSHLLQQAALINKELQDELKALEIPVEIEISPEKLAENKKKIQDLLDEALNPKIEQSEKFDFSYLPEEFSKNAEKLLDDMKRIEAARKQLEDIMNSSTATDDMISQAQDGLEALNAEYDKLAQKGQIYQNLGDAAQTLQEKNEKIGKTLDDIGGALQATNDLFNAVGEAAGSEELKVAGIVAQAVATVALSYAEALRSSSKSWVTWLAFGISGLATMVSMINSIKQATAGSYAQGGLVGGSSYYGDNLTANVNSGEMILTRRQQKNLFDAIDDNRLGGGSQHIIFEGKVRGKDLLLVQKNTNILGGKAGQSINID